MFTGFYKDTIDFLWELKMNNNRPWYAENKERCKKVLLQPMNELATSVFDSFSEEKPHYSMNVHVSRIYRDARRLYGREPFKDHLWFSVFDASKTRWEGMPEFWFELSVDSWSCGLGCYDGSGKTMERLRKRMISNAAPLIELTQWLEGQDSLLLGGYDYKKMHQDCPIPELAVWYRKKYFSIMHQEPVGPVITKKEFADLVMDYYRQLYPFYEYFYAIGKPDEEE